MGRLSKKPIIFPPAVRAERRGREIIIAGPKGEKKITVLPFLDASLEEGVLSLRMTAETTQAAINHGTMWALIKNAIQGVSEGFAKTLEISGIGYRASCEGKTLVLSLGYAHPVRFDSPEGITIAVEKNLIKISGVDKELVGQVAARVRALKPPEPYKGKGIRYEGEVIRRKVGKKAAAAGSAGGA